MALFDSSKSQSLILKFTKNMINLNTTTGWWYLKIFNPVFWSKHNTKQPVHLLTINFNDIIVQNRLLYHGTDLDGHFICYLEMVSMEIWSSSVKSTRWWCKQHRWRERNWQNLYRFCRRGNSRPVRFRMVKQTHNKIIAKLKNVLQKK